MIEINLLPLREARRKETVRFQVSVFILTVILALAVVFFLKWNADQRERQLDGQIKSVQAEIARLNKIVGEINKIKKEKELLERRLKVIEGLERGRLGAAKLFDELSRRVPEKLWLEKVSKKGSTLHLEGIALDDETIADFMTTLEASPLISRVELELAQRHQVGEVPLKKFVLKCNLRL